MVVANSRVFGGEIEGRRQWLERVLARPEPAEHPARVHAEVVLAQVINESGQPDPTRSRQLVDHTLDLARRLPRPAPRRVDAVRRGRARDRMGADRGRGGGPSLRSRGLRGARPAGQRRLVSRTARLGGGRCGRPSGRPHRLRAGRRTGRARLRQSVARAARPRGARPHRRARRRPPPGSAGQRRCTRHGPPPRPPERLAHGARPKRRDRSPRRFLRRSDTCSSTSCSACCATRPVVDGWPTRSSWSRWCWRRTRLGATKPPNCSPPPAGYGQRPASRSAAHGSSPRLS